MAYKINKKIPHHLFCVVQCFFLISILFFPLNSLQAAEASSAANPSEFGPRKMPHSSHTAFNDPSSSNSFSDTDFQFHPEQISPAAGDEPSDRPATRVEGEPASKASDNADSNTN